MTVQPTQTKTPFPWEPDGCQACCSGTPFPTEPLADVTAVKM